MQTFTGGSITNLIKNLNRPGGIWTTDKPEYATRYANAQATKEVNSDLNQDLAEGAAILTLESNPTYWTSRDVNHNTLDVSESFVTDFKVQKVAVRFSDYQNTLYGTRQTGYKTSREVIEFLQNNGLEVEVK